MFSHLDAKTINEKIKEVERHIQDITGELANSYLQSKYYQLTELQVALRDKQLEAQNNQE